MAITQGICKNCGSLIMLESREDQCECLFCNLVFPVAEAIALGEDSSGHVFPNEKYEKSDSVKKMTVTPVFYDPVPAAVKRADQASATKKDAVIEYEVSPDDVKMPRKNLRVTLACTVAFIVIVIAIALPMNLVRNSNRSAMAANISTVFSGFEVKIENEDGHFAGFYLSGQRNHELVAVTTEGDPTEQDVFETFRNFAALRGEQYRIDSSNFSAFYGAVSVTIIGESGAFVMSASNEAELTVDSVRRL